MPGHYWHPLHGDMPVRGMNDELEAPENDGEMPTRGMHAEPRHRVEKPALAAVDSVEPEMAAYLERKDSDSPSE